MFRYILCKYYFAFSNAEIGISFSQPLLVRRKNAKKKNLNYLQIINSNIPALRFYLISRQNYSKKKNSLSKIIDSYFQTRIHSIDEKPCLEK